MTFKQSKMMYISTLKKDVHYKDPLLESTVTLSFFIFVSNLLSQEMTKHYFIFLAVKLSTYIHTISYSILFFTYK